jgi:hypothetical protein
MPYQLACSFPVMAKDITGTGQVTDAGLVLRGAENPHLGGVHDADEKPGNSGGVVGKVPGSVGTVPD